MGIPKWEEDTSGRYTAKCKDEARMFPLELAERATVSLKG